MNLNPEKAVELVKSTCYRMTSRIEGGIPVEEYNSILTEETLLSFPEIRSTNSTVDEMHKKLEHVIHWIIFGAGVDIKETGDYQNSSRMVYKNSYNPNLIPMGIEKYREHIDNLAVKI